MKRMSEKKNEENPLTIEEVDCMFLELPSRLRVVKKNKITGQTRHMDAYLCVNTSRYLVFVSYQTGTVDKVRKCDGNLVLCTGSGSLCQSVKDMYDMIHRLGIKEDELIIDERED